MRAIEQAKACPIVLLGCGYGTRPQGPHTPRAPLRPYPTVDGRVPPRPAPSHPTLPRPAATRRDRPGVVRGRAPTVTLKPTNSSGAHVVPIATAVPLDVAAERGRGQPAGPSASQTPPPQQPCPRPGKGGTHPPKKGAPDHAGFVGPARHSSFAPPRVSQCSGRSPPSRDRPLTACFVGRCPGARLAERSCLCGRSIYQPSPSHPLWVSTSTPSGLA